ncbi:hypothetical protein GOP47_0029773 [Adiantum capillus-veneris]|nr:hypothetical protein GOP47_0029773 [Adiantum capillus-veneris]
MMSLKLCKLVITFVDTIALVTTEIAIAEQENVTEEKSLAATQAKLVENQQPLPGESPDSMPQTLLMRGDCPSNLYLTPTMDDDEGCMQ